MSCYEKGTSLALRHRTSEQSYPAKLTEWVNEREAFFINCQERSIRRPRNSYLCVYRRGRRRGSAAYTAGCRPLVTGNNDPNIFMLFRLIKPKGDEDSIAMEQLMPPSHAAPCPPMAGEGEIVSGQTPE